MARSIPILSTHKRRTGILVAVHSGLPVESEASQLQSPRPVPNGQPPESSHLEYPCWSRRVRRPVSIIPDACVCEDDAFSHGGGMAFFAGFPAAMR